MGLKEKLENFTFSGNEVDCLTEKFVELAPYFISGGYIKVRDDYRVYPTTVEFYFHWEQGDGIKDPIVYHRNNKFVKGNIPFFPIMSLHAHQTGYDITFEKRNQYRASALIREYQIWDNNNLCWLKWDSDSKEQMFRPYISSDKTPINTQVLYLKYILNSFPIGDGTTMEWEDAPELIEIKKEDGKPRKGVPLYNQDKKILGTKDLRPWSFSRKDYIQEPKIKRT